MTCLVERPGSLFDSDAGAIGHGVNVAGVMGAGIAVHFRRRWPSMYQEYRSRCHSNLLRPGGVYAATGFAGTPARFNIASQDRPGRHARLDWLASGVEKSVAVALEMGDIDTLALPRIGCGIGGLDWIDVRAVLERIAAASPLDIEVWTL